MKLTFTLLSALFLACTMGKELTSEAQVVANAGEVSVLSSFVRAGTTASIRAAYKEVKVEVSSKRRLSEESLIQFKEALKNVTWRKHRQKKIGEILLGAELCDAGGCYCLILTPGELIDISRSTECKLTPEENAALRSLLGP
jgi:hypothetical protein